MFCQLLPHIRNCRKLPITAPKTATTALACSHKPTAHCQHTCCQRNCLACLGPSAVQVIVSPCCRFCRRCRIPRRCRIVDAHCCRICQRPCMMPLSMHAAIPASSVYVKSRTAYCPDLSSAPAADFIDAAEFLDAADLTSAAEFPTVPLCHPSTVSSSLGQSSPKPQLSSAYCLASCCVLPHTHSADFRYCHAGCHPVATVQQCFSSAYALTDFNPVTNLPHQKNPTPSSDQT